VVVDGLVFQHATSTFRGGAVFVAESNNVLLADNTMRWNNWVGLQLWNDENVTVRNTTVTRNGGGGAGIGKVRRLRVDNVDTSRNNWRGAQGGFLGWSIAGVKAMWTHDAYITGLRSTSNSARGLWLDTDVTRVVIEKAHLCNNRHHGIFLEAVQGPVVIKNSTICSNTDGIHTGNLTQFALLDSKLCNNSKSQIHLGGLDKRVVTDHETGQVISIPRGRDWTITRTTIRGGEMLFGTTASRATFDALADTLRSDANTWWHAAVDEPFMIGGGHKADFTGWQQTTGQDTNSAFQDPGGSC
jgi:parallel beta-helix repeat protein